MTPTDSKTLFLFLCEQMAKLDRKEIDPQVANAHGNLARQANVARDYELKKRSLLIRERYALQVLNEPDLLTF